MTAPLARVIELQPIFLRPADAGKMLGICRATVFAMIKDGRLEARKIGAATVITHESVMQLAAAAPLSDATKRAQASIR